MSQDMFSLGEIKEALGALLGGTVGRLIALSLKKDRPTWQSLLWEFPIALGLGAVGVALADAASLKGFAWLATVVACAYVGPRSLEIWFRRNIKK